MVKRDHYEVLGIEVAATLDDIKRAYKKLAFVWHPDRNADRVEEATEKFREIQDAYDALSDPQERAWYDEHRAAFLRRAKQGSENAFSHSAHDDDYEPDFVDPYDYMNTTCFSAYNDASNGFYTVFHNLFEKIDEEERSFAVPPIPNSKKAPSFGNSTTTYANVKSFYNYWEKFNSKKSYSWKDEYKITEAENRQVRRIMEKENQKKRDAAKKEYSEVIRHLVEFVKRKDPRLEVERQQKLKEFQEKEKKAQQKREEEELKKKQKMQHLEKMFEDVGFGEGVENLDEELESDVLAYLSNTHTKKNKKNKNYYYDDEEEEEEEEEEAPAEEEAEEEEQVEEEEAEVQEETEEVVDGEEQPTPEDEEVAATPQAEEEEEEEEEQPQQQQKKQKKDKKKKNKRRNNFFMPPEEVPAAEEEEEEVKPKPSAKGKQKASAVVEEEPEEEVSSAKSKKNKKKNKKQKKGLIIEEEAEETKPQEEEAAPASEETPATPEESAASTTTSTENGDGKKKKKDKKKEKKATEFKCNVCGEPFSTRNKLFDHIKQTGHALATSVYKDVQEEDITPPSSAKASKKKKKK